MAFLSEDMLCDDMLCRLSSTLVSIKLYLMELLLWLYIFPMLALFRGGLTLLHIQLLSLTKMEFSALMVSIYLFFNTTSLLFVLPSLPAHFEAGSNAFHLLQIPFNNFIFFTTYFLEIHCSFLKDMYKSFRYDI